MTSFSDNFFSGIFRPKRECTLFANSMYLFKFTLKYKRQTRVSNDAEKIPFLLHGIRLQNLFVKDLLLTLSSKLELKAYPE